jgi:hypothetical protein
LVDTSKSGTSRVDAGGTETIKREYEQVINVSTNAEIVKAEVYSYHDKANKKMYAFAAVKKSELAAYYTSRIEFYLQNAENDYKLAKQRVGEERRGEALEKLAEGLKNLGETGKYQDLLGAVDFKSDALKRLNTKKAATEQEISALQEELRKTSRVFVTGRETIGGQEVKRVVSAVRSRLSSNKCRIADKEDDAGYIMTIDVNDCNTTSSGKFFYCSACIRVDIVDKYTGKNEGSISFTGPKEGWTEQTRACNNAFDKAVEMLWKSIQAETQVCK